MYHLTYVIHIMFSILELHSFSLFLHGTMYLAGLNWRLETIRFRRGILVIIKRLPHKSAVASGWHEVTKTKQSILARLL